MIEPNAISRPTLEIVPPTPEVKLWQERLVERHARAHGHDE